MGRSAAILAILLPILIPVIANLRGDDGETIELDGEPSLGEGYECKPETLRRFRRLKQAQEFVRTHETWKHPHYWAAWVLWGLPD